MNKFVLAALLLGTGLLHPVYHQAAPRTAHRIITIHEEEWICYANSEEADGAIQRIEVYLLSTMTLVRSGNFNDYSAHLSLQGLSSGTYLVVVTCTNNMKSKQIML